VAVDFRGVEFEVEVADVLDWAGVFNDVDFGLDLALGTKGAEGGELLLQKLGRGFDLQVRERREVAVAGDFVDVREFFGGGAQLRPDCTCGVINADEKLVISDFVVGVQVVRCGQEALSWFSSS